MPKVESFQQVVTFLRELPPRRQATLALAAVAVVGVLWAFVRLAGGPAYETLYTDLPPAEAQEIAQHLAAQGIPYQLSADGADVLVPPDRLDPLRLQMAAQGLPRSGRLGFELFDTPNWAGSDFAERVNYQRALEAELERTIQGLEEVDAVRVHLVMPRNSLFASQDRAAKAAVVVKLRGARLAEEAAAAITHLVASSVDNLAADEVTVINADSRMPILASPRRGAPAAYGGALEQELSQKLIATLAPIVGFDRVRATVTVEYDLNHTEQTEEIYDPTRAVPILTQQSQEQQNGALAGGIPGTASNVPAAEAFEAAMLAAATSPGQQSQSLRSENTRYAVSKSVTHMVAPAGGIRRVATAVLVDDARQLRPENGAPVEERRKWTPEEMQQIRDLAMAAVGFDPVRGDQLTVENVAFETLPAPEFPAPTVGERVQQTVREWSAPLRYVWLALLFAAVYLLVLRPIKREMVAAIAATPGQLTEAPVAALAGAPAGADDAGQVKPAQLGASAPGEIVTRPSLQQALADQVRNDPAGAARLLQNWIGAEADQEPQA